MIIDEVAEYYSTEEIADVLEKFNIKDEFTFIVTREMWDISSVKTEDGYEQTKFGFNTRKD